MEKEAGTKDTIVIDCDLICSHIIVITVYRVTSMPMIDKALNQLTKECMEKDLIISLLIDAAIYVALIAIGLTQLLLSRTS